jgi:hypothetical protein
MGDYSRCVQGRCPIREGCKRFADQGDDRRSRICPDSPLGIDCYYFMPIADDSIIADHGHGNG